VSGHPTMEQDERLLPPGHRGKSRRFALAVSWAIIGGSGAGLASGSVHDGIGYGIVLFTGILIGFCLP